MSYGKMLRQYKKTNVETAGKLDLVIMCYEKTIEFLAHAKRHYEENSIEQKGTSLQKALDIINELRCSLNMKEGGQIARNLDSIYGYLNGRLLTGDIRRDLAAFDEAIHIMSELKEAWEGIGSADTQRDNRDPQQNAGRHSTAQLAA